MNGQLELRGEDDSVPHSLLSTALLHMCTLSHVSLTVSAQLNELFVFTVAAFIFVVDCVYD